MFNQKIGVLGGGQLGKMLNTAAQPWHCQLSFLDQNVEYPAGAYAARFVEGDFQDYDDVLKFGEDLDILTIEIEKVNLEALIELESMGKKIFPSSDSLRIIRDKGLQKRHYQQHQIASSDFRLFNDRHAVWTAIVEGHITYPFVQKARRDGYDGRGVVIVRDEDDLPKLLDTACVVESLVDIDKELAIIFGRNRRGEITSFPIVEMVFDPHSNLVTNVRQPARIDDSKRHEIVDFGRRIIQSYDIYGLLAIELFLTKDGEILVNEVAPRPHNSGHVTIESCSHSQYDIQLRCLLDLPLPEVHMRSEATMINLIGAPGHEGSPQIQGLYELMATPEAYLHWYGKAVTKPDRKMGHVTIVGGGNRVEELTAKFVHTLKITT